MRYLIVGNGAAGNAAAWVIRLRDPQGQVTILSDEPYPAYYRPLIPSLIHDGAGREALFRDELTTPPGVEVRLGTRVAAIDAPGKAVILEMRPRTPPQRAQSSQRSFFYLGALSGLCGKNDFSAALLEGNERVAYDRLLIATGASPGRPSISGLEGDGAFTLRRIDDAKGIAAAAAGAKSAAVIGGGRIGTKAALALRHLGLSVAIVELLPRIVPLQFDETASAIFEAALQGEGVALYLGRNVREVLREGNRVTAVLLDDGQRLPADLIVVAVGVTPNVALARQAGIDVNRGILADSHLETNIPGIYAAGDCVETREVVTGEPVVSGIWTNAATMGECAGENMAGGDRTYVGAFGILNALELAGIPAISVGVVNPPPGQGYEVEALRRGSNYRKLVFRNNSLVGALFVGEVERAGVYTTLIREHADVAPFREAMVAGRLTYAPFLKELPLATTAYAS